MISDFVPITKLQRNPKDVFSGPSFQIVLSNNQLQGIVISKDAAKLMLDSDSLTQLREEIWELQDEETRQLVEESRKGKTENISVEDFKKQYDV